MSENTIRIRTNVNSQPYYLKFKLQQKFDFLDILSLRISQDDIYRKFCADYGVVVGRVTANEGFGIPNAKVSIFIPLDEIDSSDGLISGLYPYEHTTDKNDDGVRYNLLPKKRKNECHYPVGTFPNKREVLDNDVMLEIYEKYYKFTTTTNNAGDFMLFGIPVGVHTLHMDVDISDIGAATRRPYDLTVNGSVETLFDSPTKFKESNDLDSLRHIIKGTTSVDVKPFWGENDQCDVGINRVDYNIPERIEPSAIFIGSVISDKDKHSVNRHCRARKKAGELCELTTGGGSIEMIRKTLDGSVEYKLIKGGRVIDDDGTWSYQIPMNLKPMITDEFGNLIESEDPRKGLFSEAEVRFRVKMDTTGGEGRIREKAEYLVPHNPNNETEIDYNFDENTNDSNFFKMKWNKIYTIRNFIPRFQANIGIGVDNRNWIGIKDVDNCTDKTSFPYSRIDTTLNPLFSIIMSLLMVVVLIIAMLNKTLIPIMNMLIWIINWIIGLFNAVILTIESWICNLISWWNSAVGSICCCNWCPLESLTFTTPSFCPVDSNNPPIPEIPYMGCITMDCDQSSSSGVDCDGNQIAGGTFAPGCECCDCDDHCNDSTCGGNDGGCLLNIHDNDEDYDTHPVNYTTHNGNYYPPETIEADSFKYLACVGSGLADYFHMFKLDFYNDWVNGTLYHFLYKHKKNADHNSYCNVDYNCNGGVFCMENHVADSSVEPNSLTMSILGIDLDVNRAEKSFETRVIPTGLIKEFDNHMYYSPFAGGHKLYATDITCLGSTNRCDVDGFPYLIDRIPTTTYNIGPLFDTTEVVCDTSTNTLQSIVTESGIIGYTGGEDGLFMNVNPLGLFVNYCQSRSVRLQSELGRNIDELDWAYDDPNYNTDVNNMIGMLDTTSWDNYGNSGGNSIHCDGILGQPTPLEDPRGPESQDIYDEYARYALRGLNTPNAIINGIFDSDVANKMYDQSFVTINGYSAHTIFRGFNGDFYGAGDAEYGFGYEYPFGEQPDVRGLPYNNSYYFYFGLKPSKSAIDKLNTRFLTGCEYHPQNDFILDGVTTDVTLVGGNDGTLTIEILGGTEPYEYDIVGPNGYHEWVDNINTNILQFTSLSGGVYTIIVVDSTNGSARGIFTINEPPGIIASINSINPTSYGGCNGTIIINDISGGNPPGGNYTITISSTSGTNTYTEDQFPVEYTTLCAGDYTIEISDGVTSEIYELTLFDPAPLNVDITWDNISCHDSENGKIIVSVNGGVAPYNIHVTSSGGYDEYASTHSNLSVGTYLVEVIDNTGAEPNNITVNGVSQSLPPYNTSISMTNPSELIFDITGDFNDMYLRCYGDSMMIHGNVNGGTPPYTISYTPGQTNINNNFDEPLSSGQYTFKAVDSNGCEFIDDFPILQPNPLTLELGSVSNVSCHNGQDGSITVNFGGGVPDTSNEEYLNSHIPNSNGYKVELYNNSGSLIESKTFKYDISGNISHSATFDSGINIPAGDYKVKLYDYFTYSGYNNWGCPKDIDVTISEPSVLSLNAYSVLPGEAILAANGGTPNYGYAEKPSTGSTWTTCTTQVTGLISGDDYDFRVIDNHNCVKYKNNVTIL